MCEIKTEDVYDDFSSNEEMFDFSNYSIKSRYHDDSNKLVIEKMKDETAGVSIEKFVGLKPKTYSYLLDENSKHKKVNGVNRVVVIISHNECKKLFSQPFTNHRTAGEGGGYLFNSSLPLPPA